jgi:hypothetical protein
VLVLDNERTLEGDIERLGDQYRVRRSVGELWVQSANVLRLCRTWEEAYAYLKTRANLHDPDERIRLAHWCQLHGLRQQGIEEATAAVDLRPTHAASQRLLENMQKAALVNKSAQGVKATDETDAPPPPPAVNTESLSLFITRVQPIMMNTCASCHATGRGGAFKLTRTYEKNSANRKTTQQNLAAVLAQINRERPQSSPLLTKALSVHGETGQAPLKSRDTAAYRTLEEWVRVTIANNPEPSTNATNLTIASSKASSNFGAGAERMSLAEAPSAKTELTKFPPGTSPPVVTTKALEAAPQAVSPPRGHPAEETKPPTAVPSEPVDPFDPLIFNRQMHPQGKPDCEKK